MQLEAQNVSFRYSRQAPLVLHKVSLAVKAGQRLGLLAPSGHGKTTLVNLLAGYRQPTQGQILLGGSPLPAKGVSPVQLISQHPEHAVNPRWQLQKLVQEIPGLQPGRMQALGIQQAWLHRYPHELSGGELQRFCILRALGPATRFLIADEITTMLDPVTQAQIWQYLLEEAAARQLGMVVVTHNEYLAARVCTDIVRLEEINCITQ